MPRRTAINMALTNIPTQITATRADSATFQANPLNTGITYVFETGVITVVCALAAGEWITLFGLDNLNALDSASSVALGDILIINPFLT